MMFADEPWTLSMRRRVVAVEHIGVKVDPVGPRDRASRRIDGDLGKVGRFSQLLEETLIEGTFEVDVSDEAVGEGQPETEISKCSTWAIRANGAMSPAY